MLQEYSTVILTANGHDGAGKIHGTPRGPVFEGPLLP